MPDEVIENYDEVRKARGWSWGEMAEHVNRTDPALAARMRAEAAEGDRNAAPQERHATEPETVAPKSRAKGKA